MLPKHTSWILAFVGMLMLGHLGIIYIDLWACYGIVQDTIDGKIDPSFVQGSDCGDLEETYQSAVDKYLAIALALITGGAAGAAATKG